MVHPNFLLGAWNRDGQRMAALLQAYRTSGYFRKRTARLIVTDGFLQRFANVAVKRAGNRGLGRPARTNSEVAPPAVEAQ